MMSRSLPTSPILPRSFSASVYDVEPSLVPSCRMLFGRCRGPELLFPMVEGMESSRQLLGPEQGVEVEIAKEQVPLKFGAPYFYKTLFRMLGVSENFSQGSATDLIIFGMVDIDIILDKDWLSPHPVILDCYAKTVTLAKWVSRVLSGWVVVVLTLENSKNEEDHNRHMRIVVHRLRQEKLYVEFSKCKFWLDFEVILGHVLFKEGIRVDLAKIDLVRGLHGSSESSVHLLLEGSEFEAVQIAWLLKDYNITILYHLGKANVVADTLSEKTSSMGSLAAISMEDKPLAIDVQRLANSLVKLRFLRIWWFDFFY
ncbi:hypothetical protein MTR67_039428 [Solanum verrucosum]|uniref:Uncharacterized protein n=1 Tax=Solanum verrucosum TaxID=315347 RepID=A0AAF0UGW3_SOLVR|nr:hypothetical protein MTR67_039428 [Solanum verrucosum]